MFEIRNLLTKGLIAAAFAFAALAHMPTAQARPTERVVYSFCSLANCTDGADPVADLTSVNGTLYGTTEEGGTGACTSVSYPDGCGTVFSLDPATGIETVLHSFQGRTRKDGSTPRASLIRIGGLLYGTTAGGGTSGHGTVFSLNPARSTERVLHSFQFTDGALPDAALTSVNGTLYGTTAEGGGGCGSSGCGTVFSLDPTTGAETVLHIFHNNAADGQYPEAGLVSVNGTLYGTTYHGGSAGWGTVFSVNPATGTETILYSFQWGNDGGLPEAGLISVNGTLYGTTYEGGPADRGTVFSVDPTTGVETVVHSFRANGLGGAWLFDSLISVNGTLYGTTNEGGTGTCHAGCGTVFSLDPTTGTETVLHSFQNDGTDGVAPRAGLIDIRGTLYGTTTQGGAHGGGTVFAITHWK